MLAGKQVLIIIAGGIAAYKSLELIRRLREAGAAVRSVLTAAACEFITPLSAAALSEDRAYTDLFSLTDESEMGHIRLAREADLVVVAPATANLLAKMAHGIADDLASTVLLATDKRILVAPAMNVVMWEHPATQANLAILTARGVATVGPGTGELACGESGRGRMAEPAEILARVQALLVPAQPLAGRRALVTSGGTREPIDPVRFIANRSSGKQGHAVAAALAAAGAHTVLVSGVATVPAPAGVELVEVETAQEMERACVAALPVDVAVFAAAVADWRVAAPAAHKLKKSDAGPPLLALAENPDILAAVAAGEPRPALVVGFAAETEEVVVNALAKRQRKGCDWMVANDVSAAAGTFGAEHNSVHLITAAGVEAWPTMTKGEVAERLVEHIARFFADAPEEATAGP